MERRESSLIGVYHLGAKTGRLKRSRLSSTAQPYDSDRYKYPFCAMKKSIRSVLYTQEPTCTPVSRLHIAALTLLREAS